MGRIRLPDDSPGQRPRTTCLILAAVLFVTLLLACVTQWNNFAAPSYFAFRSEAERPHIPDLYEATFDQLQAGVRPPPEKLTAAILQCSQLSTGLFSSEDLVNAYLARIEEVNTRGPALKAIIATSPVAVEVAKRLDQERKEGQVRGTLHGLPIVVKDNINTRSEDRMDTTAGSWALVGAQVPGDAFVVERLRQAGCIILAKANLNQWAGGRSAPGSQPSGFSTVGGQTVSPFWPNGSTSGSSSGSAVASTIGLAAAALGTDTGSSVLKPSSFGNIVGIRPTVGLVSRSGVVPLALHHDTVGPMARTVRDAAHLLNALAGADEEDPFTAVQTGPLPDFAAGLDGDGLKGARIGVMRTHFPSHRPKFIFGDMELYAGESKAYDQAVKELRKLGATVVDPADFDSIDRVMDLDAYASIFRTEFNVQLGEYLKKLKHVPSGVQSLQDVVDFNTQHPDLERPTTYENQEFLELAARSSGYNTNLLGSSNARIAYSRWAIDEVLTRHRLDALIWPTPLLAHSPFCIGGYPVITVPLGFLDADIDLVPDGHHPARQIYTVFPHRPFGLSFGGTAWSEAKLIKLAYAFEQGTQHRMTRKAYDAAIPKTQIRDVQEVLSL